MTLRRLRVWVVNGPPPVQALGVRVLLDPGGTIPGGFAGATVVRCPSDSTDLAVLRLDGCAFVCAPPAASTESILEQIVALPDPVVVVAVSTSQQKIAVELGRTTPDDGAVRPILVVHPVGEGSEVEVSWEPNGTAPTISEATP